MPPVGLQLSLAGAPGADGGLAAGGGLAHQMPPHTGQSGQQIFILGQGHLKAALPGPGALGEDVQNQSRPVHDLDADVLGEHPDLGRGDLVVEHDQIRVHRLGQLPDLVHLALADKGPGVRLVLVLQHRAHALAPCRLQQGGQLLQGGFGGVVLRGQAVGI